MLKKIRSHYLFGVFVCALGALFYCYEYLLRITPSVMTTQLMQAFHIHATLVGNLAAFYYYAYTPMQIPVGVMMDRYGPRRLLILAILICGIGTELFGTPGYFYLAAFGRFLIGFGSAFAFVGVLKLATMWLPPKRFALVSGVTMTLAMLGAMYGSSYLEELVRLNGWQATIKISVISAFCLAILFILTLPARDNREPEQVQNSEHTSYKELFINLWHLTKNPIIWLNGFIGCALYLSLSVFAELWGPKYLEIAHHLTSEQAVDACGMVFLAWAIGSPIVGSLAVSFKRSIQLMLAGSVVVAAASFVLLNVHNLSYSALEAVLFVFALGSSTQILVFNVARIAANKNYSGTAIAFTNMLVMLGGSVFEPLVGKLLDLLWYGDVSALGTRIYSPQTFNLALLIIPVGAVLSVFMLLVILRIKSRYVTEAHEITTLQDDIVNDNKHQSVCASR